MKLWLKLHAMLMGDAKENVHYILLTIIPERVNLTMIELFHFIYLEFVILIIICFFQKPGVMMRRASKTEWCGTYRYIDEGG